MILPALSETARNLSVGFGGSRVRICNRRTPNEKTSSFSESVGGLFRASGDLYSGQGDSLGFANPSVDIPKSHTLTLGPVTTKMLLEVRLL